MTNQNDFHLLSYYTLAHSGENFIHQHIVDAFSAQNATEKTKLITIYFALVGLHLFIDRNFTGKQVQQFHIQLSNKTKTFDKILLPESRGQITISHVLNEEAGDKRDEMIKLWCESVWAAYTNEHKRIIDLVKLV